MRKIEEQMNRAVYSGKDWKSGNTEVKHSVSGADIYLHGHLIANVNGGAVSVDVATLRRFPTVTTKSRLRALGVDVTTKKGVTYLNGEAI